LNEWFAHWTNKLQNEQPKKTVISKKRKRLIDDDGENETDECTDSSSK